MDPVKAATGEARKGEAKRRDVDRSAVRTGSRSLRASMGAARIYQTTAGASGAKGTPPAASPSPLSSRAATASPTHTSSQVR
jgi:hypothetical protein